MVAIYHMNLKYSVSSLILRGDWCSIYLCGWILLLLTVMGISY